MDLQDDIRGRSPIQFLTPTAVTKPSFAKVIARYVFLVLFVFPSCFKYLISTYYFDSTFAVKLIFSAFCNLVEKAHVV